MQSLRNLIRHNLAEALERHPELSRLEAAWPVAAGPLTAARGRVTAFTHGTVEILVDDPTWLTHLRSLQPALDRDLARIANVRIAAIHFSSSQKS